MISSSKCLETAALLTFRSTLSTARMVFVWEAHTDHSVFHIHSLFFLSFFFFFTLISTFPHASPHCLYLGVQQSSKEHWPWDQVAWAQILTLSLSTWWSWARKSTFMCFSFLIFKTGIIPVSQWWMEVEWTNFSGKS